MGEIPGFHDLCINPGCVLESITEKLIVGGHKSFGDLINKHNYKFGGGAIYKFFFGGEQFEEEVKFPLRPPGEGQCCKDGFILHMFEDWKDTKGPGIF